MKKAAVPSILVAVMLFAVAVIGAAQQPKKVPLIGYLGIIENPEVDSAFRKGLAEHGYVEGQNIRVEYRYAGGKDKRLAELAAELVSLKVDVIVATGSQVTHAVKRATKTTPIVFAVAADPLADGFVASLARPGGNITGLSALQSELAGKRLELMKEVIPRMSRAAVLLNPNNSGNMPAIKEAEAAAERLRIRLQLLEVRGSDDLDRVFRTATREQAQALVLLPDNLLRSQQGRIRDLAIKHRLPEVF
jgi:putative tryptophan/tyrosine transport system substrate-binding protein